MVPPFTLFEFSAVQPIRTSWANNVKSGTGVDESPARDSLWVAYLAPLGARGHVNDTGATFSIVRSGRVTTLQSDEFEQCKRWHLACRSGYALLTELQLRFNFQFARHQFAQRGLRVGFALEQSAHRFSDRHDDVVIVSQPGGGR